MIPKKILLLALSLVSSHLTFTKEVLVGNITFPKSITRLPLIRLYCAGLTITSEPDKEAKQLVFHVPVESGQRDFYMLISEQCTPVMHSTQEAQNTVAYLRVPKGQRYKFFHLQRSSALPQRELLNLQSLTLSATSSGSSIASSKIEETPEQYWSVKEIKLDPHGRIPDDAIIVLFSPDFIEGIKPTTKNQLPTIVLKQSIIKDSATEATFQGYADQLLLAAIDADALHARMRSEINVDETNKRAIILATTT